MATRYRGHKQRKWNDHVYSFLLFVSSRPCYQAEFEYIEIGLMIGEYLLFRATHLTLLTLSRAPLCVMEQEKERQKPALNFQTVPVVFELSKRTLKIYKQAIVAVF